jgi:hypothetical protein
VDPVDVEIGWIRADSEIVAGPELRAGVVDHQP